MVENHLFPLHFLHGGALPDGDVPLSKTANILGLNTPIGIVVIYLGFGAGLAVFMFSGFMRSSPSPSRKAP